MEYVLYVFYKSISNFVAVIRENCATNMSFDLRTGRGFIGCSSPHFILAVKYLLESSQYTIGKVQTTMERLCFPIEPAKLWSLTPLKAKCTIDTSWRSAYQMLWRFKEIRGFVPKMEVASIDD